MTSEKITKADLNRLEKLFGISFPIQYCKFMLEQNGQNPVKTIFTTQNGKFQSVLSEFYSIQADGSGLEYEIRLYEKLENIKYVPFGNDQVGNFIVFKKETNDIYLHDHELNKFHLIDKSFNDFYNSLKEVEVDYTSLEEVVINENVEILSQLIDKNKGVDNVVDEYNFSIFEIACRFGKLNIVDFCLHKGTALINQGLYSAVTNSQVNIVNHLLGLKLDIDFIYEDQSGKTILMIAISYRNIEIVKLLLNKNPNLNIKDVYGNDVYALAIRTGNEDIIGLVNNH
jgi:ankyrin repeat protein